MSFIRTGECSQCGECCKLAASFMLNRAKTRCKYCVKVGDKYICEITAGKFGDVPDENMIEIIPEQDYKYWKEECRPFPDPNNEDHRPPIFKLPSKCTFRIVKA